MALATKCPHCNTIFRVAADQLKLRGGIVRCGSCKEVFDGNAALLDPATLALAPAATAPAPHSAPSAGLDAAMARYDARPAGAPPSTQEEPAIALDLDLPADSFDALLKQVQALTEPGEETAFDLDLDVDMEADTGAMPPSPARPEYDLKPAPNFAPEPEFDLDPAPPAEPEPEEPAFELEPIGQSAPEPEPQPAFAPDPLPEPEPVFAPEPVSESEPSFTPEPVSAAEPAFEPLPETTPPSDPYKEVSALYGHDNRREPSFEADPDEADEYVVALAAPADAMAHAAPSTASHSLAEAAPVEAAHVKAPLPEPGFVKQSRRRQRIGKTVQILMGAGSALLLVAFLAQALTTMRNQLAAQLPQLKPALESACAVLGCRVELPAQIDMVTIEQGELQAMTENTFSYMSVLHNQSTSTQAWPSLELVLNDANDKQVLRRVVAPADYLGPAAEPGKGFAARSEQPIKLYFELARLKASGYHIAVFYP